MSESGAKHKFAFYLGCIAPNRYPGVESASIKAMKKLGVELVPLKGASCCPAPGAFGSIDLAVFYAMAARNLVLAEQMKMDIALVCNGCYKSIWEVNHKLKHNKDLRMRSMRCSKKRTWSTKVPSMSTIPLNFSTMTSSSGLTKSATASPTR